MPKYLIDHLRTEGGVAWDLANYQIEASGSTKTISFTEDLASTVLNKGASLIGINDSGSKFTATDVEAALAEVKTIADAAAVNSTMVSQLATKASASVVIAHGIDISQTRSAIGISDGDDDLGSFTPSYLTDNSDVIQLIKDLAAEIDTKGTSANVTSVSDEVDNTQSACGIAAGATDMGSFSPSYLTDDTDVKQLIQDLAAEIDLKDEILTGVSDVPGLVAALAAKQANLVDSGDVPGLDAQLALLASKTYVDNAVQGLDVKGSCRVATSGNITLSGTQTIDGVAVVADDRVLVKSQTDASENGIYVVASGSWSRASDADNSPAGEVTSGLFSFVEEGTANGNNGYVLVTADPITLGTTNLSFEQFSGAGQVIAGSGITVSGNNIAVSSGTLADIADLTTLSGVASNATDLGSFGTGGYSVLGSGLDVKDAFQSVEDHVGAIEALSGVSGAVNLGAFSGSTIASNATIKAALQALETSLETMATEADLTTAEGRLTVNEGDIDDLESLVGVAGDSDLGSFSGSTISDNATVKQALQALETELEATDLENNGARLFFYATIDHNDAGSAVSIKADIPANAQILAVKCKVNTAFNGSAAVTVGYAGDADALTSNSDFDLTDATSGGNPQIQEMWYTNASQRTFSATLSGSPSQGEAMIAIEYVV